jgi:hypothetical protein
MQLLAGFELDIVEVRYGCRAMAGLDVRHGFVPLSHAVVKFAACKRVASLAFLLDVL